MPTKPIHLLVHLSHRTPTQTPTQQHKHNDTPSGYCDGASHQRKDLYRQSPFDSSIFFLQTSCGAKKWPVSTQLLQELQVAFAACCPSAAAVARQKKQRGLRDVEALGYSGSGVAHNKPARPSSPTAAPAAAGDSSKAAGNEAGAVAGGAGSEAHRVTKKKTKNNKKHKHKTLGKQGQIQQ